MAAARGLTVEEETRKREHGFPNTLEVSVVSKQAGDPGFVVEGTVMLMDRRVCWRSTEFPGIAAARDHSLFANHDEPGVIGQVGNTLAG